MSYKGFETVYELFDRIKTLNKNYIKRRSIFRRFASESDETLSISFQEPDVNDDDYVDSSYTVKNFTGIKLDQIERSAKNLRAASDHTKGKTVINKFLANEVSTYDDLKYVVSRNYAGSSNGYNKNRTVVVRLTSNITQAFQGSSHRLEFPDNCNVVIDLAGYTLTLKDNFYKSDRGNLISIFGGTIKYDSPFVPSDIYLFGETRTSSSLSCSKSEVFLSNFVPYDVLGISSATDKKLYYDINSLTKNVYVIHKGQFQYNSYNTDDINLLNDGSATFKIARPSSSGSRSTMIGIGFIDETNSSDGWHFQNVSEEIPQNTLFTY